MLAFPAGTFSNEIVLVSGTCTFAEKAQNVQAAGAVGMIVYNNENSTIVMAMEGNLTFIKISQSAGKPLRAIEQWFKCIDSRTVKSVNTALQSNVEL